MSLLKFTNCSLEKTKSEGYNNTWGMSKTYNLSGALFLSHSHAFGHARSLEHTYTSPPPFFPQGAFYFLLNSKGPVVAFVTCFLISNSPASSLLLL